jgi:hypothetical protein
MEAKAWEERFANCYAGNRGDLQLAWLVEVERLTGSRGIFPFDSAEEGRNVSGIGGSGDWDIG